MVSGVSAPPKAQAVPKDSTDAQVLGRSLDELNEQAYATLGLVVDLTSMLFGAQIEKEAKGRQPVRDGVRDGVIPGAIDKAATVYDLVEDMARRLSEIIIRLRL